MQRSGIQEAKLAFSSTTSTAPTNVLGTHYVTIAAITRSGVASGEGVLIMHEGEDRYPVRARLRFGE